MAANGIKKRTRSREVDEQVRSVAIIRIGQRVCDPGIGKDLEAERYENAVSDVRVECVLAVRRAVDGV